MWDNMGSEEGKGGCGGRLWKVNCWVMLGGLCWRSELSGEGAQVWGDVWR